VEATAPAPAELLQRALESDRVHSAYLFSGPGAEPREAALAFARAAVCSGSAPRPCEACSACRRSAARETIEIDGTGSKGPLLRHVGDHPDLFWVERGANDTRVRIGQVRALQAALRLRSAEGGRRAAVVADAEWLNQEAQNALLRILEEPPPLTTLVLVTTSSSGLLATVRSRCQKLAFRPPEVSPLDDAEGRELAERFDSIGAASVPEILDWAETYRGARAPAAAAVGQLLATAVAWLRRRVAEAVRRPDCDVRRELAASRTLAACRKSLAQRNANPQMVAERALLALREASAP
jgi:DNA polymerase III delta prime subunit